MFASHRIGAPASRAARAAATTPIATASSARSTLAAAVDHPHTTFATSGGKADRLASLPERMMAKTDGRWRHRRAGSHPRCPLSVNARAFTRGVVRRYPSGVASTRRCASVGACNRVRSPTNVHAHRPGPA